MNPLLERLKRGDRIVADGAMGTMLFRKGLEPGECPESVNLTEPGILEEIARAYLDAGAEIIESNTFGASPAKLSEYGLDGSTEEINTVAVEAVRKVVGDRAYVSASCGPSAKILKPYGDTDPEELATGFERQVTAQVRAGADLICVETMTDLNEAILAVEAAKRVSPGIPVAATMTFDETPRGFFTIMGVSVEEAASGLERAGADMIGSNCGNGIETMVDIARIFRKHSTLPILIQSNAGQPEMIEGQLIYPETPEFFAEKSLELFELGISIVGGCCGTTPSHIREIRRAVDTR